MFLGLVHIQAWGRAVSWRSTLALHVWRSCITKQMISGCLLTVEATHRCQWTLQSICTIDLSTGARCYTWDARLHEVACMKYGAGWKYSLNWERMGIAARCLRATMTPICDCNYARRSFFGLWTPLVCKGCWIAVIPALLLREIICTCIHDVLTW